MLAKFDSVCDTMPVQHQVRTTRNPLVIVAAAATPKNMAEANNVAIANSNNGKNAAVASLTTSKPTSTTATVVGTVANMASDASSVAALATSSTTIPKAAVVASTVRTTFALPRVNLKTR